MDIKMVSAVLFVKDIQVSRKFYEDVLGQRVAMDHGPNVGFEGGFALWQREHAVEMIFGKPGLGELQGGAASKAAIELYFECDDLDATNAYLDAAGVRFIHLLVEQPWGQRVVRFYDPDGHIVEIGEPMPAVIVRYLRQGLAVDEIARRTSMPAEIVAQVAAQAA